MNPVIYHLFLFYLAGIIDRLMENIPPKHPSKQSIYFHARQHFKKTLSFVLCISTPENEYSSGENDPSHLCANQVFLKSPSDVNTFLFATFHMRIPPF